MQRRGSVAVIFLIAALVCSHLPAFAAPAAAPEPGVIPGRYIVRFKPGVARGKARELARLHRFLLRHVYSSAINGFAAEIPDALLPLLRADPSVLAIEPDRYVYAAEQTTPTGVQRVEAAPAAKNATARIDGVDEQVNVDIAILDTGISDHPDLNVVGGKACVKDNPSYSDDNGHGTHVAGTAGALDNDIGVVGVAPGARLWAVKVLDSGGYGSWADVICGLDWVTAHADTIEVANMSLSSIVSSTSNDLKPCGANPSVTSLRHEAVCNAVSAGVTVVAAAGNYSAAQGQSPDANLSIPGAYPEVINVSALRDLDGAPGGDSFASFSKYGSSVDIAAPGVSIYSTRPTGYGSDSGTSMAAPHVAGAVGLCRATEVCGSPSSARQWVLSQAEANDLGDANHREPILNVNDGLAWGAIAPDTSAPSVPTGVAATPLSTSAIDVTWTASTDDVGVSRYVIYRNGERIAAVAGTSFQDTGLKADTEYRYRVVAKDAAGNASAKSAVASATTLGPPAAPTGLSANQTQASADGEAVIALTWVDNAADETGYRVYRRRVGGTWRVLVDLPADSTTHTDRPRAGRRYEYKVVAFNEGGKSGPSNIVVIKAQ